eukprot:TRINITY_DN14492_c0_g1_i1.p1 TRINITY_DN14492_c0_g1~~TRINITY_DN14492_c0_g1_i1.p1  ORF type:complete len:1170 (+),score=138.46 TRINITY_DN14492_c0_g1_i1:50-3559(+)
MGIHMRTPSAMKGWRLWRRWAAAAAVLAAPAAAQCPMSSFFGSMPQGTKNICCLVGSACQQGGDVPVGTSCFVSVTGKTCEDPTCGASGWQGLPPKCVVPPPPTPAPQTPAPDTPAPGSGCAFPPFGSSGAPKGLKSLCCISCNGCGCVGQGNVAVGGQCWAGATASVCTSPKCTAAGWIPMLKCTPLPPTPAPATPAPPTNVPTTPAPATPSPETPAPETPAPPTPLPGTPAPPTPSPATPAPPTAAPLTPAPPTPVPPTQAPPTPSPRTPAPLTPTPATPAPPTPAPASASPPTLIPATPAPPTPAPGQPTAGPAQPTSVPTSLLPTPAAPTAAPSAPSTASPATPAPPTPAPPTPAPPTPAPPTTAPLTPAPATAQPRTPAPPTPAPAPPTSAPAEPVSAAPHAQPSAAPRSPVSASTLPPTSGPSPRPRLPVLHLTPVPTPWTPSPPTPAPPQTGIGEDEQETTRTVLSAGTGGVLAAGALGQAVGAAPNAGKIAVLLKMSCKVDDLDLDSAEPIDWELHPVRKGVGNHPNRYFAGAVLWNSIIVALMLLVLTAFAGAQVRSCGLRWVLALGNVRCPGVAWIPYLFLLQGISLSGAHMAFKPQGSPRAVAAVGWLTMLATVIVPTGMWLLVLRESRFRAVRIPNPRTAPEPEVKADVYVRGEEVPAPEGDLPAARPRGASQGPPLTGWRRRLHIFTFGRFLWVSTGACFVERFGVLFEAYREGMQYFAIIEQAHIVGLSLFASWETDDKAQCTVRNALIVLILLLYAGALIWKRPYGSLLENGVSCIMASLLCVAVVLLAIGMAAGTGTSLVFHFAAAMLMTATALLVLKAVFDLCMLAGSFASGVCEPKKQHPDGEHMAMFADEGTYRGDESTYELARIETCRAVAAAAASAGEGDSASSALESPEREPTGDQFQTGLGHPLLTGSVAASESPGLVTAAASTIPRVGSRRRAPQSELPAPRTRQLSQQRRSSADPAAEQCEVPRVRQPSGHPPLRRGSAEPPAELGASFGERGTFSNSFAATVPPAAAGGSRDRSGVPRVPSTQHHGGRTAAWPAASLSGSGGSFGRPPDATISSTFSQHRPPPDSVGSGGAIIPPRHDDLAPPLVSPRGRRAARPIPAGCAAPPVRSPRAREGPAPAGGGVVIHVKRAGGGSPRLPSPDADDM